MIPFPHHHPPSYLHHQPPPYLSLSLLSTSFIQILPLHLLIPIPILYLLLYHTTTYTRVPLMGLLTQWDGFRQSHLLLHKPYQTNPPECTTQVSKPIPNPNPNTYPQPKHIHQPQPQHKQEHPKHNKPLTIDNKTFSISQVGGRNYPFCILERKFGKLLGKF